MHPAVLLMQQWMADESGYDEQIWPILEAAMQESGGVRMRTIDEW